jgi:hypothetical protein
MDFAERSSVLRRFDGTFTSVLAGLHGEAITTWSWSVPHVWWDKSAG